MKKEKITTKHKSEADASYHIKVMQSANPNIEFHQDGKEVYWYSENWSKEDEQD